jgi:hypothetical protein
MKRIILLFALLCLLSSAKAQIFCDTVLTHFKNGTPVNGTKIKTNLPFTNGTEMPTIILEGYNFGTGESIGLIINFYVYDNVFSRLGTSSFGSYAPRMFLANEGGKVVIFIDSKDYYQRFAIRAFAKGMTMDVPASYQGWSVVDEAILGTATQKTELNYVNKYAGTVLFPNNGSWNKSGRVGVNLTNPLAPLHVIATAADTLNSNTRIAAILGNAYNEWTTFGGIDGGRIRGSNEGYLVVESNPKGSDRGLYLNHNSPGNIIMAVGGGSVGIGTSAISTQHKLTVEGSIGARKIQVTSVKPWPDYIFGENYTLTPLYETEKYVKAHKHLPDMPSAKEVAENGIDLGEMNRKLLEKMEEMTLHMIRMQKKIDELESRVQAKL